MPDAQANRAGPLAPLIPPVPLVGPAPVQRMVKRTTTDFQYCQAAITESWPTSRRRNCSSSARAFSGLRIVSVLLGPLPPPSTKTLRGLPHTPGLTPFTYPFSFSPSKTVPWEPRNPLTGSADGGEQGRKLCSPASQQRVAVSARAVVPGARLGAWIGEPAASSLVTTRSARLGRRRSRAADCLTPATPPPAATVLWSAVAQWQCPSPSPEAAMTLVPAVMRGRLIMAADMPRRQPQPMSPDPAILGRLRQASGRRGPPPCTIGL
jgi:hypothetical protein